MTDPGQRVLPGAGPILPPMPLPPELPADETCACPTPRSASLAPPPCPQHYPVESPELPIPAEAVEAVAEKLYQLSFGSTATSWDHPKHESIRERYRRSARDLLAAALPHLRSLQVETQIEFGRALGRQEFCDQLAEAFLNFMTNDVRGRADMSIDRVVAMVREIAATPREGA